MADKTTTVTSPEVNGNVAPAPTKYQLRADPIDGEQVRLGGHLFIIPSLSVRQAKKLWPEMLKLDQGITVDNLPEKWEIAIPIIYAALSRNYPDIKEDEIDELVDVRNIRQVLLIIAGQSGLRQSRPGAPGEKQPVAIDAVDSSPESTGIVH